MHYKLALIGFGNVARLARLLIASRTCSNNRILHFHSQAFPQANMDVPSIRWT